LAKKSNSCLTNIEKKRCKKKAAAANIEVVGEERRRVVEVGRLGPTNQPAKKRHTAIQPSNNVSRNM
jgi:hypothetical protein